MTTKKKGSKLNPQDEAVLEQVVTENVGMVHKVNDMSGLAEQLQETTGLSGTDGREKSILTLEALLAAAKFDPSSPFGSEQRELLARTNKENLPDYERVIEQLKMDGVRVSYLDKHVSRFNKEGCDREIQQADEIFIIAITAGLFRTPNKVMFADITVDGHRQTHSITSTGFRRWLRKQFYLRWGCVARSAAVEEAIRQLDAVDDVPEFKVYVRVAPGPNGKTYLDLGDSTWRAVEVDACGWRIVSNPPVRFRRPDGMLPLPVPLDGGTLGDLFAFINITDPVDRVLVMSWAVASFDIASPQPVLVLTGRKGSAKTTVTRFLGQLLDPSALKSRMLPRENKDFFIAADKRHILCFDNTSAMPDATSDIICQLVTGGGFGTRGLYTNGEEFQIEAMGSVILNGIENVVTRQDLADRSIVINLPTITNEARRTEQEYWSAFDLSHSRMLGLVLDGVVAAFRNLPTLSETAYPRMADFAKFCTAAESAYWPSGTFKAAYRQNIAGVVDETLEADPVATALISFMEGKAIHTDTADGWHSELVKTFGEEKAAIAKAKANNFPKNGRALSSRFSRAEPFLAEKGLVMTSFRENNYKRTRKITFTRVGTPSTSTDDTDA